MAYDKMISYGDFVSMGKPQQIETIKLVHDFLTEAEHQQRLGARKNLKYQTYLKILNYFISEAHANENQALFEKIPRDLKCYYGGWISFIIVSNGKSLCTHPKHISKPGHQSLLKKAAAKMLGKPTLTQEEFQQSEIYKFYVEGISKKYDETINSNTVGITFSEQEKKIKYSDETKSCNKNSSLPCNPDIYGTKSGSVFCLESVEDKGLNAAYLCQRALEDLEAEEKANAYDDILSKGINGNSHLFSTLTTMYDTCLCKGQGDQKNNTYSSINQEYAEQIFYSRTCAGILNQTQQIKDTFIRSCSETSFQDNSLKDWKNYLTRLNGVLNNGLNELRQKHESLEGLHLNKISSTDVIKYFDQDKTLYQELADKNLAEAKAAKLCPVLSDYPSITLKYDKDSGNLIVELLNADLSEKDKDKVAIKHIKLEGAASVASSTPNDLPKGAAHSDQKETFVPNSLSFSVTHVDNDSDAVATMDYNGNILESNKVTIPGKEAEAEVTASCEISIAENSIKVSPKLSNDSDEFEVLEISTPDLEGIIQNDKDLTSFTVENLDPSRTFSVSGKLKYKDKEIGIETCNYEPKDQVASKCNLSLKQQKKDNGEISLIASIEIKDSKGNILYKSEERKDDDKKKDRSTASSEDYKKKENKDKFKGYKITWLDLSRAKVEKKKKDKEESDSDSSVIDDEDSEEDQEALETEEDEGTEEEEKEEPKKDKIDTAKDKYFKLNIKDGKSVDHAELFSGIQKLPVEQKFAAILESGDACKIMAETTIEALIPRANNGNPQFKQSQRPQIKRSTPAILKGLR